MKGGSHRVVTRENWVAELPGPAREAILGRMTVLDVPAGGIIARAGDPASRVFQVVEGYVRLDGLREDGRQALITIYLPGNCYAETAMVARRAYHHTSTALTPARIRCLGEADFWDLYSRIPEIPDALCRKFAAAITRQIASREMRATQRLGKRIASMFENLATECGEPDVRGELSLAFPLTQSDIADLFDVTRQSVHREITSLRSAGLIDKRNGVWVIRNLGELRRVA